MTYPSQILDCATVSIEVASNDAAVVDYVVEYFDPWFQCTQRSAEWRVAVTSSAPAYDEMQRQLPADAVLVPCFAHDQRVLSLPAWRSGGALNVSDAQRSCFLRVGNGHVDLIGDPSTRRWRFTLLWILHEIAATRLRRTHVDLHAATVAAAGRALMIAGSKNAGKTTLSLYLLRSGAWSSIANDRSFVRVESPAVVVEGMPTAVKIRESTLSQFPELRSGLPPVARPYLYNESELDTAEATEETVDSVGFFALTPNQIAQRLGADTRARARLGAIVFPQLCEDEASWGVEPLTTEDVGVAIQRNLYGAAGGERSATLFEDLGGGYRPPSDALIGEIAARVAGYRLRLGPNAYADNGLSAGLLRLVA